MWIAKAMRMSRQPTPLQIKIDKEPVENVEEFNYLGSTITNDAMCTREIMARIAMAKAAFNRKETLFTSKLDLELRTKLEHSVLWCRNLDSSETRSEVPRKF
jgi:hypothetical protein